MGLLLLAAIVWIFLGRSKTKDAPGEESAEGGVQLGKISSVLFTLVVLVVVAAALYEAQDFPHLGAIFPMAATIPAIFMAAAQLVLEVRATREAPGIETRRKIRLALGYFFSLVLYLLLIWLVGFGIATTLYTFGFLYGWSQMRWFHALIYTGVVVGLMLVMNRLLGLYWPEGMLLG